MSTPNPFNIPLYESPIKGATREVVELNIGGGPAPGTRQLPPLDPFGIPEYATVIDPPSMGATFLKGVGSGLLHPVRAIVGRDEVEAPPDGWTTGHTVASFAGEIAGVGIGFLPFLKATQVGLKAIGLGARGIGGTFVRTPAFAFAEGAVSGAAFEVGSDTMDTVMERVAVGAGLGMAAEAVLLGAGRVWRGRWAGATPATGTALVRLSDTPEGVLRAPRIETVLNPAAVALERNLHPAGGKSFDEAVDRLRAINNHQDQLSLAAARVAKHYQPFGFAILGGIENPGQALRALRRQVGWEDVTLALRVADPQPSGVTRSLATAWDQTADGKPMYEILMIDALGRDRFELLGESVEEIVSRFMPPGGPGHDYDEVLRILKTPGTEPIIPVTHHKSQASIQKAHGKSQFSKLLGFARPGTSSGVGAEIHILRKGKQREVLTLIHEYVHHFTFAASRRTSGTLENQTILATLFDDDLIGRGFGHSTAERTAKLAELKDEFQALTVQSFRDKFNMTRKEALDLWASDRMYYDADNEQLSRAVEVMFFNPELARELAPQATDFLARAIQKYSPRLEMVLSKNEHKRIHQILKGMWRRRVDDGSTQIFREVGQLTTNLNLRDFERTGFWRGMNVQHQGEEWIVQRMHGLTGPRISGPNATGRPQVLPGQVEIRNPMTQQSKVVPLRDIHRPLMQNLVERNTEVVSRIKEMLKQPARWLGVVLKNDVIDQVASTQAGKAISKQGVRKAIVNLENFERVDDMSRFLLRNKEIHERVLANFAEQTGGRQGKIVTENGRLMGWENMTPQQRVDLLNNPQVADQVLRDLTPDDVIQEMANLLGVDGVLFDDGGRYLLYVAKPENALQLGDEVLSPAWVKSIDGRIDGVGDGMQVSPWIMPSQENVTESLLREAGVGEREMAYFKAINPFEDIARETAEQQGLMSRIMEGISEVNAANVPESVDVAAARAGTRVDVTTNGEYRVLSETGEELARASDEGGARAYLSKMGPDPLVPDLEMGQPMKSTALPHASGGSVAPPKPFQQMPPSDIGSKSSRFLDSTQLFLAAFTAMENIAKSAERRGFGPAFTKVFHPIQQALERVDNLMGGIKRDALGGKTFSEQMKLIEQLAEGPLFGKDNKARRELAIRAIEAVSKEEIAQPGGLLKRGLSQNEIALANTFESLQLQDDIPRLTGILRMAKSAVNERGRFPQKLANMMRVEVNEGFRQNLEQLAQMIDNMPDTVEGVLRELGLDERQMTGIGMIDEILKKGVDDQSLFAISRYANAKPLTKGYKTARDEVMAVNGFTPRERRLVEEMEKAYKAAFGVSNLNHKKEIGGYWPHMRKWIENGFEPAEEFIRKHVPESVEWSAERVRTGELDVYLMDPVLTTAKYIRSMLMKQEFDPILPEVKAALASIEPRDPRLHAIFSEYVHEAMGRPHASFGNLHRMISRSSKILLGREPDPRFTRDIVNSLGSLANAAAIPFRPMLIARNYFQMTQMIPARTGVGEFFDGLRMAISDEGFKEAVEKNIVTKNVLPVHAATEIYGHDTSRLSRRLQRVFAKGFEWYQKPDDIGRAAAFFAAKSRIAKHMDDRITGRITHEQFKSRAKINTYDSIDIQEFDKLWAAGRYTEASDYIGSRLARETIFRYGHANHPAGWGSVAGRLYGTFGTWPTQYKDFLLQGMTRGSTRDRAEFLAIHGAVNAATLAAGAAVGVDLMSWVAYPSLNYTGGPFADLTINTIQAFGGSPTEKGLAKRNIRMMFPTLEDPRSIFIPGSFFIGDLYRAANPPPGTEPIFNALGIRELNRNGGNPFAGVWD